MDWFRRADTKDISKALQGNKRNSFPNLIRVCIQHVEINNSGESNEKPTCRVSA